MKNIRLWRRILLLGVCFAASTFLGTVVFGQTAGPAPGKKEVNRPKVDVKTVAIAPSEFVIQNARAAVPKKDRKPITLADVSKRTGKDLTPDTPVTLPGSNQTMTATVYVQKLSELEDQLNEHGYSIQDPPPPGAAKLPKAGITVYSRRPPDAQALAKQRETILAEHQKVTADVEKQGDAATAKYSKANLAGEVKTAKANEAAIAKNYEAFTAELRKVDAKKLTPAEKTAYDHVEGLTKKSIVTPAASKKELHASITTSIHDENKETAAVVAKTAFLDKNLEKLLHNWFANSIQYDKVFPWHWGYGNTGSAEVHVDGDFELHGAQGVTGSTLSTKDSLKLGGSALGHSFTVLDIEAGVSSSKQGTTTTSQLQVSAKLFGEDIFSPVNDTTSTESKSVDHDYPFDVSFVKFSFVVVVVPVTLELGVRGDLHYTSADALSPVLISSNSTVNFNSSLYALAAVDLVLARGGITGTLTLANEKLEVLGAGGISTGNGALAGIMPPHINFDFSVKDQLTLLSGEVDLFVDVWGIVSYDRLATLPLFGFGGFTPINGYLLAPQHIVVPQPLAVSTK